MKRVLLIGHEGSAFAYQGLGITADRPRSIVPGTQYEKLFPAPEGTDPIVNKNAEVHDTLRFVREVVLKTLPDTKKISQEIKKSTLPATLKSIFDFFYSHYRYKLDKFGVEQVRRPARAWKDRKSGIDCDCFTTSVSSILTNLGIEHYLKIIAIKKRPYYQHIYVVVPKSKNADLSNRNDYWVIDPVLNSFDEEAPTITKTDYLKMEKLQGIPLQYLNGIDDAATAGLGSEFDELASDLSSLGFVKGKEDHGKRFKRCLGKHVRNTINHVRRKPTSVTAVYEPKVLVGMLEELEGALNSNLSGLSSDDELMGTLERLSAREHLAVHPRFRPYTAALNDHDDHLYGVMFGDTDDQMLSTFSGLGKKGRAAAKAGKANSGKKGFFTKAKNAVKHVTKAAKTKVGAAAKKVGAGIKKIGKGLKKFNPVSVAARAGFLVAMRTNFAMIAEKAYWGYQTAEDAKAKGITADFHSKAKALLEKIRKVFIKTLAGEESALKKAILNGRAAKKVTGTLKKQMHGLVGDEVAELTVGTLGVAAAAGSVSAAMAFLTPIIAWVKKNFQAIKKVGGVVKKIAAKRKAKKAAKQAAKDGEEGAIENENGTASDEPSTDPNDVSESIANEAKDPQASIIENDGSEKAANAANDEPPSDSQNEGEKKNNTGSRRIAPGSMTSQSSATETAITNQGSDPNGEGDGAGAGSSGKSKAPLIIGGLAALALVGVAMTGKKPAGHKVAVAGLGGGKRKKKSKVKSIKLK